MTTFLKSLPRLGAIAALALAASALPAEAQRKGTDTGGTGSTPYRLKMFPGMSPGSLFFDKNVITVPAGQRLVITEAYIGMTTPSDQGVYTVLQACSQIIDPVNGTCHLHPIAMNAQPSGGGTTHHVASHSGRIIVEAEEFLRVSFSRGSNLGSASGALTLLGYLESAN